MEDKKPSRWLLFGIVAALLIFIFSITIPIILVFSFPFGQEDKATGNGSGVNCGGAADVPVADLPFVADAATKYLNGDQAALISLIQIESSWKADATTSGSSARGLGQFLTGTAKSGFPEFTGGPDVKGKVWPAGQIFDAVNPADARFDPERSIYAAARFFGNFVTKYGDISTAYIEGYHGHTNDAQLAEAKTGAGRLMDYNSKLKNGGGCQEGGALASGQTFSCTGKAYAFPVADAGAGYGKTHHNYSATDIYDIKNGKKVEGATVVAVTSGKVTRAGNDGGKGGNRVSIDGDDGLTYYYAHMQDNSLVVKANQRVTAGQPIGKLGETGDAVGTFPHVHFGISDGNQTQGYYPSKFDVNHSGDAVSNYRVLDAWKQLGCIDPKS